MEGFPRDAIDAAAKEREVTLTTIGRKSGKPHRVTIWIVTDANRIFIRSGRGLVREWTQNLITRGEADIDLGRLHVKFRPRHITDAGEARLVSQLYTKKYGSSVQASKPTEALTLGELASFELLPAREGA